MVARLGGTDVGALGGGGGLRRGVGAPDAALFRGRGMTCPRCRMAVLLRGWDDEPECIVCGYVHYDPQQLVEAYALDAQQPGSGRRGRRRPPGA